MTVVLNRRSGFTLDVAKRVAWDGEDVTIGEHALETIKAARTAFLRLLESDRDQFIYGTTTRHGMGARFQRSRPGVRHGPERS